MKTVFLICIFLTTLFQAFAQDNQPAPVTLEKISENLYQVVGGRGANGGMYIGDNEVMIIDSKMDKASVEAIFKAVAEITDKPVTMLINTHSDGDHVNGNQFFPEDVVIVSHENCRKEMLGAQRNGEPSAWSTPALLPFVPEITFSNKMNLYSGSKKVELHYFGIGHTTGDIVVFFPEEKTAFIGDQVFFERPQLIHSYKGGNSFEHVTSTKKMLSLDIEKFCTGHAEIKSRDDVLKHIEKMVSYQYKIDKMIKGKKNLDQIKSAFSENEARLVETVYNEIILNR